jgi:hypothetical protein
MATYLRVIGWTLLGVTILHGYSTGRWRELHALGMALATVSIAGGEAR